MGLGTRKADDDYTALFPLSCAKAQLLQEKRTQAVNSLSACPAPSPLTPGS